MDVKELIADLRDWRGGPDSEFHLRTRAADALEELEQENTALKQVLEARIT